MRKRIVCFLLLLLLFLCGSAFGELLSLSHPQSGARLRLQSASEQQKLFLPGAWANSMLAVHTDYEHGIWVNETLCLDGDLIPCPEEGKMVLRPEGKKKKTSVNVYRGSAIPCLFLSCTEEDAKKIYSDKSYRSPAELICQNGSGGVEYAGSLEYLKTRGNSTFGFSKKPYQIKLSEKTALCGLNRVKKFVLLADSMDVSLLRNRAVLSMARAAGLPYTSDCLHADVYLNGSYRGLYLLTEKIGVGESGVDIRDLGKKTEKLNPQPLKEYPVHTLEGEGFLLRRWYELENDPENITGGYLLETDKLFRFKQEKTVPGFVTANEMPVYIKKPEYASRAQVDYIGGVVSSFHRAILAKDGVDPDTGRHYSEIADVNSLAVKFLIEEITKNYDALLGSQYFCKDAGEDSLLTACCAWDYDLSCGDIMTENFHSHSLPAYFYIANYTWSHTWWNNLLKHKDFQELVIQKYNNVFHTLLAVLCGREPEPENGAMRSVESLQQEIADSAAMNYRRWSIPKTAYGEAGVTFGGAVRYLNNWLDKRMAFLDHEWLYRE